MLASLIFTLYVMKLTVLGSGSFWVTDKVSASAFLLDTGSKKILIDCGPGTLAKLSRAGFRPSELDYIFITHFHPDHTSDLYPLFVNFRLADIFKPGSITRFPMFFGPEGMSIFMSETARLTELPAYDNWGKIKVETYRPDMEFEHFTVKTFPVTHHSFGCSSRSYALRFEVQGNVIAFSGDAARCRGLQDVCQNADLFVCDASFPGEMKGDVHVNALEIGEIAQKGNVKKVMLSHFNDHFADYDLPAEVREEYTGEVVKARDLEVVEV